MGGAQSAEGQDGQILIDLDRGYVDEKLLNRSIMAEK